MFFMESFLFFMESFMFFRTSVNFFRFQIMHSVVGDLSYLTYLYLEYILILYKLFFLHGKLIFLAFLSSYFFM